MPDLCGLFKFRKRGSYTFEKMQNFEVQIFFPVENCIDPTNSEHLHLTSHPISTPDSRLFQWARQTKTWRPMLLHRKKKTRRNHQSSSVYNVKKSNKRGQEKELCNE